MKFFRFLKRILLKFRIWRNGGEIEEATRDEAGKPKDPPGDG